jgi:hypothetical protein
MSNDFTVNKGDFVFMNIIFGSQNTIKERRYLRTS